MNLRKMRGVLGLTGVVLLALTGCATTAGGAPSNATSEELGAIYGACDQESVEGYDPLEFLASTEEWVQVIRVIEARREPRVTSAVTFEDGTGSERTLNVHSNKWPGIDWAAENGADVWFAVADTTVWEKDLVATALIATRSGAVFFPGNCVDIGFRQPLFEQLGPDAEEVLAGLPLIPRGEVREYLGLVEPEPVEGEVILNPDSVDESVLEPLTYVGFTLTTTDVVADGMLAIATRVEAGWNDGVMTDRASTHGTSLNAYLDESGVLEFWLLDYDGNVSEPLGKLGEVQTHGKAVNVLIDTSGISADGEFTGSDRVTVVE